MATIDDLDRKLDRVLALLELGRPSAPRPAPVSSGGGSVYRFGQLKGKSLAGSAAKDLRWYGGVLANGIDDPARAKYRDENVDLIREINALLEGMGEEGLESGEDERPPLTAPRPGAHGGGGRFRETEFPTGADDDIPF